MIKYTTNSVTKNTTSRTLETLSAGCNLQEKSVEYAQNAEYEVVPDSGYDGLSKVNVSVDVVVPTVQNTKTVEITSNGETTIKPDSDYDVLEEVKVNTNIPLQEKAVDVLLSETSTEILPDAGYTGITKLTVNHSPVESNTAFTANKNGKYTITPSEGYDATTSVNLNVEIPVEATKSITITENGTTNIIPSDGYDSIEGVDVTVNVTNPPEAYDISSKYVSFNELSQIKQADIDALTGWNKVNSAPKFHNTIFAGNITFPDNSFDSLTSGANFFRLDDTLVQNYKIDLRNLTFPNLTLGSGPNPYLRYIKGMFYQRKGLEFGDDATIERFPKITRCDNMFYGAEILNKLTISGPVTRIDSMFYNCSGVNAEIRFTNAGQITSTDSAFSSFSTLTYLEMDGLTISLNLRDCTNLTEESVTAFIANLGTAASGAAITFASTQFAYLTEDQIAEATAKGWTINQA